MHRYENTPIVKPCYKMHSQRDFGNVLNILKILQVKALTPFTLFIMISCLKKRLSFINLLLF